jgi:predicted Rossmann fold nucleotide-binding protein DprA/Smf involved in DNA uptake
LVTDAAEVLDLCGDLGGDAVVPLRGLELPLDHLPAQVRAVHDAVPPRAGVGVDHIVRVTGQPPLTVIRHLAVLVVDGHLRERGGTWVRVRRRGVADCANAPAG